MITARTSVECGHELVGHRARAHTKKKKKNGLFVGAFRTEKHQPQGSADFVISDSRKILEEFLLIDFWCCFSGDPVIS